LKQLEFDETMRSLFSAISVRNMRAWHRFVVSAGISHAQFAALVWLYRGGPTTVNGIARKTETTSAAASQLVERLVQADLLQREEDPNDRRTRTVKLSVKGRRLMKSGWMQVMRGIADVTASLTAEQRADLAAALPPLLDALRKEFEP